jgi:hypothetical protein
VPTTCEKRNADLLALAGDFKYVVLAGFWSSEANDTDLESGLRRVVEKVIQAGAVPVIFKDNPYHEPDLSQCILHRKRGWIAQEKNCNIPYSFVAQTQGAVDDIIDRVKARYPQTLIVDPKRIMCNSSECVTYISNTALYKDANHINTKAANLLGEQYVSRVGNPFVNFQVTHAEK